MSSGSASYVFRITCSWRIRCWHISGNRSRVSVREPILILPSFNGNRRCHVTVAAQVLDNGPDEHTLGGGARKKHAWGPLPYRWKPNTKNIIVGDLLATLEAHRDANKDRVVRKIKTDGGGSDIWGLALQTHRTRGAESKHYKHVEDSAESAALVSHPGQNSGPADSSSPVPPEVSSSTSQSTTTSMSLEISKDNELPTKVDVKAHYKSAQGRWSPLGRGGFDTVQRPWTDHVQVGEIDAVLRLDEEIRAFERYMMLSVEEEASAQQLITHVKGVVASVAPSNEVSIHGSRYTRLASPLSDIDFAISLPEEENSHSKHGSRRTHPVILKAARRLLRKIMSALQESKRYKNIEYIAARIDLVTATDLDTGIIIQISALAPYKPAREYTMMYLKEYVSLRPLYTLLRHSLVIRNLNTVYEGGIGSYPLLIMIVTALKHADTPISSDELGNQLLHVLQFWSHADLYNNGYSADPPRVFPKISSKTETRMSRDKRADPYLRGIEYIGKQHIDKPWLLCLQDPGNATNDLGKKATEIRSIQGVFSVAYDHIRDAMRQWNILTARNVKLPMFYRFLDNLMKANYADFENQRAKLRNADRQVHDPPSQSMKTSTSIIRRCISEAKYPWRQSPRSVKKVASEIDPHKYQDTILQPSKPSDSIESEN